MTPRRLTPHPTTPSAAVTGLEVEAARTVRGLELRYRLTGEMDAIRWPAPAACERTDELWRHTCFEAFVKPVGGEAYVELNFAPSTQWAAYRFDGYRAGMTPANVTPHIEVDRTADGIELRAVVEGLPDGPWRVALTAVVEMVTGEVSYWSLAHPPGRPDFHHADCFCLEIP